MGLGGSTSKGWSAEDAARCATACDVDDAAPAVDGSLTLKEIFIASLGFGLGFGFCAIVAASIIALVFA